MKKIDTPVLRALVASTVDDNFSKTLTAQIKAGRLLRRSENRSMSTWIAQASAARILECRSAHIPVVAAMNGIRCRLLPGLALLEYSREDCERAALAGVTIPALPPPSLIVTD